MTEVVSPLTVDDALLALRGATEQTWVLAGGTDLMVEWHTGRSTPDRVVDVSALSDLCGVREEDSGLRLGALTTCTGLLVDPRVEACAPMLISACREFAAVQIRNRATLGGNLGTASPAADLNPVLLALQGTVRLRSSAGSRELPMSKFFTGYRRTARRSDELIESVWLPPRPGGQRQAYRKVGTRRAQSIAKVVVALALELVDGVVRELVAAAGSVAERTVILPTLSRELVGFVPSPDRLLRASRAAATDDCAPIDDVRSTASYRRHVLQRVLYTELEGLCAD